MPGITLSAVVEQAAHCSKNGVSITVSAGGESSGQPIEDRRRSHGAGILTKADTGSNQRSDPVSFQGPLQCAFDRLAVDVDKCLADIRAAEPRYQLDLCGDGRASRQEAPQDEVGGERIIIAFEPDEQSGGFGEQLRPALFRRESQQQRPYAGAVRDQCDAHPDRNFGQS
jgi:hypothetical protein